MVERPNATLARFQTRRSAKLKELHRTPSLANGLPALPGRRLADRYGNDRVDRQTTRRRATQGRGNALDRERCSGDDGPAGLRHQRPLAFLLELTRPRPLTTPN